MQKPHGKNTPSFLQKSTVWHTGTRKRTFLLTKEGRVRALEIMLERFWSFREKEVNPYFIPTL
jgi:hypothetical protein